MLSDSGSRAQAGPQFANQDGIGGVLRRVFERCRTTDQPFHASGPVTVRGVDERKAHVIELRYFGGMTREEIAQGGASRGF